MGLMFTVERPSAWQFVTYGGGGIGLGIFAASGGQVILKNPAGKDVTFTYGGAGVGWSYGFKIPKIGKIQIPTRKGPLTGAGGPFSFPTTGKVFVSDNVSGDLSESDIRGVCLFTEVGGGLIGGGSAMAMFVDLNPLYLGVPVVGNQLFVNSAKGMILMAGLNVGVQAQVGASGCVGYLH